MHDRQQARRPTSKSFSPYRDATELSTGQVRGKPLQLRYVNWGNSDGWRATDLRLCFGFGVLADGSVAWLSSLTGRVVVRVMSGWWWRVEEGGDAGVAGGEQVIDDLGGADGSAQEAAPNVGCRGSAACAASRMSCSPAWSIAAA
jgi:hypothetical protein